MRNHEALWSTHAITYNILTRTCTCDHAANDVARYFIVDAACTQSVRVLNVFAVVSVGAIIFFDLSSSARSLGRSSLRRCDNNARTHGAGD